MSKADDFLKYLQDHLEVRKTLKDATLEAIRAAGLFNGYHFTIAELAAAIPNDPGPAVKKSDWVTGPGP